MLVEVLAQEVDGWSVENIEENRSTSPSFVSEMTTMNEQCWNFLSFSSSLSFNHRLFCGYAS